MSKNIRFNMRPNKAHKGQRKTGVVWSPFQQALFRDVAKPDAGHTIVLAVPGSGKSTTILESLYHIPEATRSSGKVLMAAFNSSIVEELEEKSPKGVDTKTFHRIGFQAVREHWGHLGINGRAIDVKGDLAETLAVEEVGEGDDYRRLRKCLVRAFGLAKAELATDIKTVEEVVINHAMPTGGISTGSFALHIFNMMNKTLNSPRSLNGKNVISFDDMLWLPVMHHWSVQQYERVFIDECQDLSNVRTELILSSLAPGGRLVAVGDKFQAIYGFAGSTSGIVDQLRARLGAKMLPLSVSYRLPKRVIDIARKINPGIEPADNAIDGVVENVDMTRLLDRKLPAGCAILSRANFPLVSLCFKLVSAGYKANIQGKDIGNRFLWRIDCWEPDSVQALIRSVESWRSEMGMILKEKKISTSRLNDEADSILAFTDGAVTVSQVQERIKKFFSDDPAQIKLSSAHKSKGLEWDNVMLMHDTFKPGKNEEENCIYYVAVSRAKRHLTFINGKI